MRKGIKIFLIVFLAVLLLINVYANLFARGAFNTELGCSCEMQQGENRNGEMSCNEYGKSGPYLITGIFNVYQDCPGQEIITCENGAETGRRVDYDCSYKWNVLFLFP
ncbi:MAG: hypothetical protein KJ879_01365 [Nanoarchaeota archaeon]|nr:hypothetical protein [Nanoarchaeota archaeon]